MKPEIKIFLQRLLLFLFCLVLVDTGLGYLFEFAYFSQRKGQFAQTTYSIDSTKHDILIFGSSRAVRHYSPSILSKTLEMSCYNVGRDAQMLPYYAAMQTAILKRYKPKIIILDVNSWEISPGEGKYEKLSVLFPYARRHPELLRYLTEISRWENVKLASRVYPYNSSLFILGYNCLFSNKVQADDNGYAPLTGEMTDLMLKDYTHRLALGREEQNENSTIIDHKALNYYREFLKNTAKYNIKTYVVISPKILDEKENYKTKKLRETAQEFENVTFINFSRNKDFNFKYQKFSDPFHLNKQGAEEFSQDLLRYLKMNKPSLLETAYR